MTDAASFDAWWSRPVEWIDVANTRGAGWSRTGRARAEDWPELGTSGAMFVKRQQDFYCRPLWNLGRRTPTLRRERRALELCRAHGVAVPRVLGYAEHGARAVLLLEALPHVRNLEQAMMATPAPQRAVLLSLALETIFRLHALRIRHGALYPKHVLVSDDPPRGAWLIDLEKARHSWSKARAMRRDLRQFLRHAPFLTDAERAMIRGAGL